MTDTAKSWIKKRRPARTTRPNCGRYAKVVTLRDHWKECMS